MGRPGSLGSRVLPGEGGTVRVTRRPTCPVPPAGTGGLPTVPALACVGLLVLGVQLAFGQVGEADADGGQGLRVVRVHDVAREPHPKFLGRAVRGSWDQPSWALHSLMMRWSAPPPPPLPQQRCLSLATPEPHSDLLTDCLSPAQLHCPAWISANAI